MDLDSHLMMEFFWSPAGGDKSHLHAGCSPQDITRWVIAYRCKVERDSCGL